MKGHISAHLEGRGTEGALPRPNYTVKENGTVVVSIWVDNYGKVVKAKAGVDGTTISDKDLWTAARNAAMNTRFKFKFDAPALQEGTISYAFFNDVMGRFPGTTPITSVKNLVEKQKDGFFKIKATYNDLYSLERLIFLVEEDDYIIPVQLVKKDLGAEKRFYSLRLAKGDTLVIKGELDMIRIENEYYKGLKDAVILSNEDDEFYPEERTKKEPVPFQLVAKKPKFQGGDQNDFSKWVISHLIYPDSAKRDGIQGRVVLQFTIKADGSITNVVVFKGLSSDLDKEVVRVVSSSPSWEPGIGADGNPVDVSYTFPVVIQIR